MTDRPTLVRRPDVLWRSAPGFLVLSTVDGETSIAKGGAAQVWDHLSRPIVLDPLLAELARRGRSGTSHVRSRLRALTRRRRRPHD